MLLNHSSAFAGFPTVQGAPRAVRPVPFDPGTLIETDRGWLPANRLCPGDVVQTFDGGPALLKTADHFAAPPVTRWHVPAGALGNCSAFDLIEGQYVGFRGARVDHLFGLPVVLAPAAALAGFRRITRAANPANGPLITLTFATEELAMTQTGTLLQVPGADGDTFYQRLSYGEARALLKMTDPDRCAPDRAAAWGRV